MSAALDETDLPVIPQQPAPLGSDFRLPMGRPDAPYQAPTMGPEVVGAAFRLGNPIVSVLTAIQESSPDQAIDPTHNPLDTIGRGSRYEQFHLDRFLGSRNESETRAIMASIDREDRDRQTLDASGTPGTVIMAGASLVDPTIFLPAGGMVRAANGALSPFRSAVQVGALAGLQAGVSEAALQLSQQTRTSEESVFTIGSATLLGGLLGGGLAAAVGRTEVERIGRLLDTDREAISAGAGLPPGPVREPTVGLPGDVGAAAADARTLELKPFLPDWLAPIVPQVVRDKVGDVALSLSPTSRVFALSDSIPAKRAVADLAESALGFTDEAAGITPSRGIPLSRLLQQQQTEFKLKTSGVVDKAFSEYRYGRADVLAPAERSFLEGLAGRDREKLDYRTFAEEVTRAMWSGDVHPNPFVQRAAQELRQQVYEPIRQELVKAGLFSKDAAAPAGDKSFAPRMLNREKAMADRPALNRIITDWLAGEQTTKAAAKERVTGLWKTRRATLKALAKLEGRLSTAQRKADDLGARLSERAMEVRATGARAGALEERAAIIAEDLTQLDEFIATMRGQLRDPEAVAKLADLEEQAAELRRQQQPLTLSDLDRIEREEVAGTLTGDLRTAAEIALGRRNALSEGNLLAYVAKRGISASGDVRAGLGDVSIPGLIRKERGLFANKGAPSLDDWGEILADEFNLPQRLSPDEVLRVFEDAAKGKNPAWWAERSDATAKASVVNAMAAELDEMMSRLPDDYPRPGNLKDFTRLLNEAAAHGDDFNRAADEAFASLIEAAETKAAADAARAGHEQIKALIAQATERARTQRVAGRVADARTGEAGVAVTRNRGRLGLLEDRAERNATVRELLDQARQAARQEADRITAQIEDEIRAWKGKSAADGLSALKSRDKAEAAQDSGARLRGADKAVDRAVKRIIASERDFSPEELSRRADEVIDRWMGGPDGRLPYDLANPDRVTPAGKADPVRGSLNERDFAIPSDLVADFLEMDVNHLTASFLRTTLPDLMLKQRFTDIEMKPVMREIADDFNARIAAAGSEKERVRLGRLKDRTIEDVAALRDRLRGTYGWTGDPMQLRAARFATIARSFNVVTDLGSAVLNSMSDLTGVVFRYGMTQTFADGWGPMFKSVLSGGEFKGAALRQAKAANIAVETQLNLRAHSLADVAESYRPQSKRERGLAYAADKSQLLNGMAHWTDALKTVASAVASADILRATERVAAGRGHG